MLLLATLLAVLLPGCPSFQLTQVEIAPDSIDGQSFTLTATVSVTEEDPPVDDGNLAGGRGVLGVWLPPDWTATGARVKDPDSGAFTDLIAITDAAGHFPPSFPRVPGSWFAFVSMCDNVPEGTSTYQLQIDIEGQGTETVVTLGVAVAMFNDAGSNGPVPREISVDLGAQTATVRQLPPALSSAGLDECPSIPYEEAKNNGCGCALPGKPDRSTSLLGMFMP